MQKPFVLAANEDLVKRIFVDSLLIELLWRGFEQAVELRGIFAIPPLLPDYFVPLNIEYLDDRLVLIPREGSKRMIVLQQRSLRVDGVRINRDVQSLAEVRHEEL